MGAVDFTGLAWKHGVTLFIFCLFVFWKKKTISLTLFRSKRFQQKGTVIQYICNKILMLFIHFLKVAALMVSTITHAFVILGTLEGTATEILMTAALPLVNTVRLLDRK